MIKHQTLHTWNKYIEIMYKMTNIQYVNNNECTIIFMFNTIISTGPRSAVGNVSGYRCEADCRSRGREFDPGPVPYFRGD